MNQQLPNEVEILNTALEKSGGDRIAYVEAATLGNPALRDKIEALLRACERGPDLLDDLSLKFDVRAAAVELTPGALIEGYEIMEQLGEGGCGAVYRAEQKEPLRRQVALKIIKAGMDTKAVIARFEAERQALAMMDHPNIAKVHDGGTTEHGRPYFVMEFVRGTKITDYCNQNNLSIQDRLNLFLQVCDAVQHAHQKGIIHRDLKPSNILVQSLSPTSSETLSESSRLSQWSPHSALPKVIDFGIAKAIEGKLTDDTVHTALHQFIGTPAYMSPEQAQMSPDIDTRTDIYSLGVLLYELLTGKPPFDNHELLTAGLDEMRRIIREVEPPRPSQTSKSQIKNQKSQIPFDLDSIVLKCLEKDRSRRYETASALAADVQRHLNNEPVLARPASSGYRFQKFVHRNRLQFAAASAVSMALVAAAVISSIQMLKAKRAALSAEEQARIATVQTILATRESDNAKAVKDFLVENLLGVDCCGPEPDEDALTFEATQALIQKIARRLDGRFTNQPATEADFRMAMVRGLHASRDFKEIAFQAEKALKIRKSLFGPAHSNTLDTIKELAFARYQLGQKQEAFNLLSEAIPVARQSTNGLSPAGAAAIGTYGILLAWDGHASNALPYIHEALSANQKIDSKGMATKAWKSKLAEATEWSGDIEKAEELWRDVLHESETDLGKENPFTLQQLKAYARLLAQRGRWDKARPLLEQAAVSIQAKNGATNFSTLDAQVWLGRGYEQNNEIERAAKLYSKLHPSFVRHFPYAPAMAYSMDIANFFVRHHQYDQAKTAFAERREWFEQNPPKTPGDFERFIAATAGSKGWEAAAKLCAFHFDSFADSPSVWLSKARIFRFVRDEEQYQRLAHKVLGLPATSLDVNNQHVPLEIAALGHAEFSQPELEQIKATIATLETVLPARAEGLQIRGYRAIAHMHLNQHRSAEALAALEKSLAKQKDPDPYTLFLKAIGLQQLDHPEDARGIYSQAIVKAQFPNARGEGEAFLSPMQLYQYVVLRRESEAVLALTNKVPKK